MSRIAACSIRVSFDITATGDITRARRPIVGHLATRPLTGVQFRVRDGVMRVDLVLPQWADHEAIGPAIAKLLEEVKAIAEGESKEPAP